MFLNKLAHVLRLKFQNLKAAFARRMVTREVARVLQLTHAQELLQTPMNEWAVVKSRQVAEIQAVRDGKVLTDIIDRRSWAFPYLPEALHRLNQPLLKNTPYNLRRFSETPIPRRATNLIKNAVLSFDWQITPGEDADSDDPDVELRSRIVTESLKRPNKTDSFRQLLEAVLEDLIIGGYGCIEPRMTPYYKRPFKMWAVDGSTIRIFPDWTESTPDRPHYAQMTGLKGERGIITFLDEELIYIRDNIRTSSPFGLGKLEVAFNTVNAFLGAQDMASKAGSDQVHKTWLWWEQAVNPAHIQTVRRHIYHELEGQQKISLMGGMKKPDAIDVQAVTPEDLLLDWQEFLIRIIANAFDISPLSLGLERDVNRNTGQVMADADFRNAVVPMAKRIEEAITAWIHSFLGWKDLQFGFIGLEDPDSITKVMIQQRQYMMNALTPDEIREEMDRPPLPGGWGRLTMFQSNILMQEVAARLGGKTAGAAGARMGSGAGSSSGGSSGMPSGDGGVGNSVGPSMSPGMKFAAQQVAQMLPEEIEMYQELGLLPPTQQLGDQMEEQAPGILETLSDELRHFFQHSEEEEELAEIQPAPITPAMEREQEGKWKEAEHQESLAETVINRRAIFGPATNQQQTKDPFRGKYPRSGAGFKPTRNDLDPRDRNGKDAATLSDDIAKRGRRHYKPGKGNPYAH